WLLGQLPRGGGTALEVGCGIGTMARRLASSFERVIAFGFSPSMIAEAQRRAPSIDFVCADLFDWLRDHPDAYDCVVSISTLHHVALRNTLRADARSAH